MSKWLIPLYIAALFLACGIGFVISGFFGYHYTALGAITGFVITVGLFVLMSFVIVEPLNTLIDREAQTGSD